MSIHLAGGMPNPMTSKEDLIKGGTGGKPTRLAKGAEGKVLGILSGVLAWITAGVADFLGLSDTPSSYEDQAGKTVKVNDEEDALEFTPLATPFDIFDKYRELVHWNSLDGYHPTEDGTGTVEAHGGELVFVTDNESGQKVFLRNIAGFRNIIPPSGKVLTIEWVIPKLTSITDQTIFLHLTTSFAAPPSEIYYHLGWKIVNARLWASSGDNSAQESTDTEYDFGTIDAYVRLKIVYTVGSDAKFYVNGVLVATHTTHIPYGYLICMFINMGITTNADASKAMYLSRFLLEREY